MKGSHRIQTVSHQQNVFTRTAQESVTVMILFDKTHIHSDTVASPKNMHTHIHSDTVASPKTCIPIYLFLFFIELLGYKSNNVIISFDKLLSELTEVMK